ncbi:pyruvate, orthophosphate dikinase [Terrimicrobium sacchariphilum]|uniref:Pyruvate, phosphate dikinase n=1 Tax=Terrimicrobium sacchariphilum TaxID=690879 RepID=A0A146G8E6_TERSA|nr:pyruvate, phosphate dikinase [Terrimicrobium sacchariphilum]GAT32916.1 pyruvate, orthophosphate dikinase [Terrimicrobium sacchariphilum]
MSKKSKSSKPATARKGKYVYYFGDGQADGDGKMRALLGGKGANLAEMTRIGLPVPPGFTITTEVCSYYYDNKRTYPPQLAKQVDEAIAKIEKSVGKGFEGGENPLLLSVRSGARDSMPGMMDTILNLGMNDKTVEIVASKSGNPKFAWDSYRRFLQMYGDVVMGVQKRAGEEHEPFESVIEHLKDERYGNHNFPDMQLTVEDIQELVSRFKALIRERTGKDFPQKPKDQLWGAVSAVFGSWQNDRAIVYRRKYGIPHEWGTAVNVQTMVFGNMGETSATGVAFTRDPASGEKVFYGEYLINAQGEDVVAGVRTPNPVVRLGKEMPESYKQLLKVRDLLETHFRDMQDLEFTIEDNRLYILQTRNGKRTGLAAVKIAVDMVKEKLITKEEALSRIPADSLSHVLAPIFDKESAKKATKIASGLPAGPGAASGRLVLRAEDAVERAHKGDKVLLVRVETSPEDLRGMIAAEGILTARGGVSSHAALVARQMGKVCVCGASDLQIDYATRTVTSNGVTLKEGDYISIDGTAGDVFAGEVKTAPSEVVQVLVSKTLKPEKSKAYQDFAALMTWADKVRRLDIRTNADTPEQVENAVGFGAEGVGLCRTEHMFFEGDRIDAMREMILARNTDDRRKALEKLLPFQREDFIGIFRSLDGLPATIRLLDPPLHEFLPHDHAQQSALSNKLGIPQEEIAKRVHELHEFNPMLGHRGCRLGIVYPEISEMQARAIFEAAAQVQSEGIRVRPEVMIPLVGFPKELKLQIEIVNRVAKEVIKEKKVKFKYLVGTMIEVPRAALVADKIAEDAEFFSFGTNDLTQTTLGMSRDDSGSFIPAYTEHEIIAANPFATIDQDGVGELMKIARDRARKVRKDIKLGICGEHGGEPKSVEFCHALGLNYVSCSPFRVPIARLAAAQAVLKEKK